MPVSYHIDTAQQVVIATASGILTNEDLIAYFTALRQDPSFEPHFAHLSDYREVSGTDVTGGGIRAMVAKTPFLPTARRAFVFTNPAGFAIVRMFQMSAQLGSDTVGVFHTLADAYAWLGLTMSAS